ncbi:Hypothetical predicted protein [Podarcis lilfordi]|uniref:Uncharacterized protein n=1 Tax=Podarcis lilfordi TaxID=74358 RepID=A0AA35K8I3_9SAUR|nr:Hypothetical predicted protein [Podarcis lilfordi]
MEDSDYISSDEEISTKKERHYRLGEDNLDDTIEYDYSGPALRFEKSKPLQTKDSCSLANEDTGHDVEAKTVEAPDSVLTTQPVPLTPVPVTEGCVLHCSPPSPSIIKLNSAMIPTTKNSIEGSEDKL